MLVGGNIFEYCADDVIFELASTLIESAKGEQCDRIDPKWVNFQTLKPQLICRQC